MIKHGASSARVNARLSSTLAAPPLLVSAGGRLLFLAITALVAFVMLGSPLGQRGLLALGFAGLFYFLLVRSPAVGVPVLLVYLSLLGGLRRWLIPVLGIAENDPLLLVGPLLATLFFVNLHLARRAPADTRLARLLPWLLALMILQMVNPLQGGLTVGLAGALFYLVPVFWYYLGRSLGTPDIVRGLLGTVVGVSLAAAVYGMYQHFVGFLPGEIEWMRANYERYAALNVGGALRAFSFFTSSAEYSLVLLVGALLLWGAFLSGNRLALAPIPLLLTALFLVGSRSPIVILLATAAVLWAIQGRSWQTWLPRGLLAVVVGIIGLVWSLNQVQQRTFDERTQAMMDHQAEGLLNPFDEKSSTAQIHSRMFFNGIEAGLRNPLGHGLGATTLAAVKFGAAHGSGTALNGDEIGGTELDLSNLFVSLGVVGGALYAVILFLVLRNNVRYWRSTRSPQALAILAVLLACLGQWLNGGQYATALVVWFCIGALDRALAPRGGSGGVPIEGITGSSESNRAALPAAGGVTASHAPDRRLRHPGGRW